MLMASPSLRASQPVAEIITAPYAAIRLPNAAQISQQALALAAAGFIGFYPRHRAQQRQSGSARAGAAVGHGAAQLAQQEGHRDPRNQATSVTSDSSKRTVRPRRQTRHEGRVDHPKVTVSVLLSTSPDMVTDSRRFSRAS